MFNYFVLTVKFTNLESMLNSLENIACESYEIVSIVPRNDMLACVVVKFNIAEPDFDEVEIRKKLLGDKNG